MNSETSRDRYQQKRFELKEYGQDLLKKIPESCAKELAMILTNFEKNSLTLKTVERKRYQVGLLKDAVTSYQDVSKDIAQNLMEYLAHMDIFLRNDEKYCYLEKIFISNFRTRFFFFVRRPHSYLFKVLPLRHTIHLLLKDMIDSIGTLRVDQMKIIASFGKEHEDVDQLIPHVHATLNIFSKKYLSGYSQYLDDENKDLLIATSKESFPKLGNNKLLFFQRPKQVAYLDTNFERHIRGILEDYVLDYVAANASSYHNSSIFFYDIAIVLSTLLLEGDIEEQYINFAHEHISDLFQSSHKRKMTDPASPSKTLIQISHSFNETVHHTFPEKAISPEFFDYLTNFLEPLALTAQQKANARHFFLRMQRNKKEIRILDAEKKFGMKRTMFSDEQLQAFEKFGCPIVFSTPDEIAQEVQEETPTEEVSKKSDALKREYPELPLYDALLTDMKHFSREKVLEIFEIIGYEIKDRNTFMKQLERLFGNETLKKQFLRSLKRNGRLLQQKVGYQAIEIAIHYRIIFFQNNLIDGIYNHGDYLKRIKNILR